MTKSTKTFLLIITVTLFIIIVSVIAYYIILGDYALDAEDRLEGYYNMQMVLKGIFVVFDIQSVAIFSVIAWSNREKMF